MLNGNTALLLVYANEYYHAETKRISNSHFVIPIKDT